MNIGVVVPVNEVMFELQLLVIAGANCDIEIVIIYPPVSKTHRHIFLNEFETSFVRFSH